MFEELLKMFLFFKDRNFYLKDVFLFLIYSSLNSLSKLGEILFKFEQKGK